MSIYATMSYVAEIPGIGSSAGMVGGILPLPEDPIERHEEVSKLVSSLPGGPEFMTPPGSETLRSSFIAKDWTPGRLPGSRISYAIHFMSCEGDPGSPEDLTPWRPIEDDGMNPVILGLESVTENDNEEN